MSNATSTAASTTYTSAATTIIDSTSAAAAASSEAAVTSSIAASVSSAILGSTVTVEPSSTNVVTSTVSASAAAASTELITSVVTESETSGGSTSLAPVTVVVTSELPAATTAAGTSKTSSSTASSATATSSTGASLSNNGSSNGSGTSGLSTAGKTAIAVVVPVVVVALLVLAGLYLWRRRKQKKLAEETRRKEVEDYGYNPNNDPTLPAIGSDAPSEMTEDGGYRGWGAATMSNRKASTTISGGHTQGQPSESGSNPGYATSPPGAMHSDVQSGETLTNNRSTMNSDDLGALGAAPAAGAGRYDGMKRGPSNASSSYSAGNHSDTSDPPYGQAISSDQYQPNSNYSFTNPGPYGDGSYGGGDGMPVVRDVSARRNTRIEQGRGYQANSGIAQNF